MTQFNQQGQTVGTQFNADHIDIDHVTIQQQPLSFMERQQKRNREQMLASVQRDWIQGFLEPSEDGVAKIALELQNMPGAVLTPALRIAKEFDKIGPLSSTRDPIEQIYDQAGGALLILGEPGAGKTILLLTLARTLLEQARLDAEKLIPVVFPLSSWGRKRQPLKDWLIAELQSTYQVPGAVARFWIENDQILPLLDGLDEVDAEHRKACVEAINTYRQEHGFRVPTVVCSRRKEYEELHTSLNVRTAVVIQPLTPEQIEAYLSYGGQRMDALRSSLENDPDLQTMAKNPLMLNILTVAYQGAPSQEITATGSLSMKQDQVFALYVKRMLAHRSSPHYSIDKTKHWLTWLARQMAQRSQFNFLIERLQPDWLPTRRTRLAYHLSTGLGVGLFCLYIALLAGLILGIPSSVGESSGLLVGLIYGSIIGLICGLIAGLRKKITPAETVTWSWKRAWLGFRNTGLVIVWLISLSLWFVLFLDYQDSVAFGSSFNSPSDSFPLIFNFLFLLFLSFIIAPIIIGLHIEIRPLKVSWSLEKARRGFGGSGLVTIWLFLLFSFVTVFSWYLYSTSTGYLYPGSVSYSLTTYLDFLILLLILLFIVPITLGLRIRQMKPFKVAWSWKGLLWGLGSTGIIYTWLSLLFGFYSLGLQAETIFIYSVLIFAVLIWIISGIQIKFKPFRNEWLLNRALHAELIVAYLPALLAALPLGLIVGFFTGLSGKILEKSTFSRPNEGIRRSARNSIRSSALAAGTLLLVFLIVVLIVAPHTATQPKGFPIWRYLGEHWIAGLLTTFPLVLPEIMIIALIIGLVIGGLACIKHIMLRLFLQRLDVIPPRYPQFLDYAADLILLRKVGGSYIFLHRLLLDHFAGLQEGADAVVVSAQSKQEPVSAGIQLAAPEIVFNYDKPVEIAEAPTVPFISQGAHLLPCGHEWRPNSHFCAECGFRVQS